MDHPGMPYLHMYPTAHSNAHQYSTPQSHAVMHPQAVYHYTKITSVYVCSLVPRLSPHTMTMNSKVGRGELDTLSHVMQLNKCHGHI